MTSVHSDLPHRLAFNNILAVRAVVHHDENRRRRLPRLEAYLLCIDNCLELFGIVIAVNPRCWHDLLPFEVVSEKEKAFEVCSIRFSNAKKSDLDFRSSIQVQNHFNQHVMELSFLSKANLDDLKKMTILKAKISNNLMQWHSAWSLLIDVSELEMDEKLFENFDRTMSYFQGFFLKKVIGYGVSKSKFPFKVYRSRHKAAAELEANGHFSADEVRCRSGSTKD